MILSAHVLKMAGNEIDISECSFVTKMKEKTVQQILK